ncbi:hypothetical protein CGRA01v4_13009 [Colletotrichum graminicola]|uniref:Uncharacterized protein n=1 Tax=Colletotrichum graminicola (strain M1.001 / M2 / FGSC 10212) TaxID=645133 RepID=E3QLW1_COLGM|nr:uncharacterized protein GLRG_06993 [Colletotrichum graminicola M1.001]EFQ31849.1 hypothetical protein GLRG_06993 [Colletotrichum graminicola M1.001]WDK21719.1 hypothetical protein CGRA01v4_13009 [Colletotrichum graminicola]
MPLGRKYEDLPSPTMSNNERSAVRNGIRDFSMQWSLIPQVMPIVANILHGGPWREIIYVLLWITFGVADTNVIVLPFVFIKVYPSGGPHVYPATQPLLIAALTAAASGGTTRNSATPRIEQQAPVIIKAFQDVILCGSWRQSSFFLQMLNQVVAKGSSAQYAIGIFLTVDASGPVDLTTWWLSTF